LLAARALFMATAPRIPRTEHKKNIYPPSFTAKFGFIQILAEVANPMSDQRFFGVNY
jgi:hypothetical protein